MAGTFAIPRIVVGAATSSAGKTTIATGLMAALTARGFVVQPFKVGPDFIDPTHHTRCCGRACRNLDPFMMGEDGVRETFARASAGADVAVIEGVMGLHDGVDGTALGSTAHVARLLEAPVLLAVDAKGASRTVHAVVRGVAGYDPAVRVAGVVFNRLGSARHRELIEPGRELPVLGWIPRDDALAVPSRHLGLSLADELASHDAFGDVVGTHVDLDGVIAIARSAPPLAVPSTAPAREGDTAIGVALDRAFCFYYADNLDRLRDAGAHLVFFSPATDDLPDVDALYIGGGYPETPREHARGRPGATCNRARRGGRDADMGRVRRARLPLAVARGRRAIAPDVRRPPGRLGHDRRHPRARVRRRHLRRGPAPGIPRRRRSRPRVPLLGLLARCGREVRPRPLPRARSR